MESVEAQEHLCTTCGDVGQLTRWGARISPEQTRDLSPEHLIDCPDCPEPEEADPRDYLAAVTPGYSEEEVLARVERAWVLLDGRFPIPKFAPACSSCRGDDVQFSRIVYGKHEGTVPGRADVVFKCCACSMSWIHGVALSEETYRRATAEGRYAWGWREIVEAVEEEEGR